MTALTLLEGNAQRGGNFDRWIPRYRRELIARNAADRTVTLYVGAAESFYRWLQMSIDEDTRAALPLDVEDIAPDHIRQFISFMREHGYIDHRKRVSPKSSFCDQCQRRGEHEPYGDSTLNLRYRSLQQFFRFLEPPKYDDALGEGWGENVIQVSPFHGTRPPKIVEKPVDIIREGTFDRLIATKKSGKTFEDRRDLAILLMWLDTGLRRGGMASMLLDDLDLDEREVRVIVKGGALKTVVFGHPTRRALERYLDARDRQPFAWRRELWISRKGAFTADGIRQMLDRTVEAAGVGHIYPHMFRHTFAHNIKKQGRSDEELMRLAHWRSPQMPIRYGASAGEERARDAYREHGAPSEQLSQRRRNGRRK